MKEAAESLAGKHGRVSRDISLLPLPYQQNTGIEIKLGSPVEYSTTNGVEQTEGRLLPCPLTRI